MTVPTSSTIHKCINAAQQLIYLYLGSRNSTVQSASPSKVKQLYKTVAMLVDCNVYLYSSKWIWDVAIRNQDLSFWMSEMSDVGFDVQAQPQPQPRGEHGYYPSF